ncbi:MAG TPA: sialidase family protein [Bacteroidales bacterium]|nr:sialidase family protein [Bacteroidales bacterium]
MKLQYILPVIILCSVASCTPDPSYKMLESYSFYYDDSQGRRLLAGESTNVLLNYYINTNTQASVDSVRVVFEPVSGGGSVTQASAYVASGKNVTAVWQLGSDSFKQVLRASVYDLSGNYLTSADQVAYGFRENEWDEIAETPDGRMRDMVADTVNNVTLMVANGTLYRQGERYYIWEEMDDPVLKSEGNPHTVEIDSNGVIYVSTWNGVLFKSLDHGESWSACTKPYPDRNEYIYNYISNDNTVWAFAHGYPIKRSKDEGLTWTEIGGGLETEGFGDIFRLKNGIQLFHGSNCCSLYISYDDGITWTPIPTPGYSIKLYVNDNDEITICTQLSGIAFYRSTDYGATFTNVHHVSPQFGTSMENTFNRWKDFYYVIIPGFGILKSYDLVHYEKYWLNYDLRELFIDHNGVLIAKDWDLHTVYYRHNTE